MNQSQINFVVKTLGEDEAAAAFAKIKRAAEDAGKTVKKYLNTSAGESDLIALQTRAAAARSQQASATQRVAGATDQVASATDRASRSQAEYLGHIAKTTVLSAGINKLFLELVDVSGQAIQQVDLMNNFPATMASMGQSTDAASKSMDSLRNYIGQVGGNLGDATSYVTRFAGAIGDVKAATAVFVGLNNALIAGDSTLEEQKQAAIQFAQALERGKPDLREWRTLTQNMSFQLDQVAKSMGYVNANELGEALSQGKESMAAFTTELTKMGTGTGVIAQQAMARMNGMQFAFNVMKNTLVQGLAAIINTLGRSNIASFFQFVTQVIQVLTGWIVKLITVVVSLLNFFGRLFGLPAIQLQKDVAGIASGVGSAAGNADDLADGMGKASKEAKEMNKTLAGFDKMNVLDKGKPAKDDGAGAGGAGFDAGQLGQLGDLFGDLDNKLQDVSKWAKIFAGILAGLALDALLKKFFDISPIQMFIDFVKSMIDKIKGIPGAIANIASKMGTAIAGWYRGAKVALAEFAEGTKTRFQQLMLELGIIWGVLGPRIAEQFQKLKAGVLTVLDNLGITKKFQEIKAGAILVFNTLKDNVVVQFELMKAMAVDKFEAMKSGIYYQMQVAAAVSGTLAGGIVRAIQEKFEPMATVITAKFYEIKDVIYGQLQIAAMNAGIAANRIVFALYDTFGPLVEGIRSRFFLVKDAVVGGVTSAVEGARTAFARIVEVGGGKIKELGDSIKKGFDLYVAPIAGPVGQMAKLIGTGFVETLRSSFSPVVEVARGMLGKLKGVFGKVDDYIVNPLKNGMNAVSNKLGDIGSSITDKIGGGMKVGLFALGTAVIGAVVSAIKNPEGIVEAFNGFIDTVLNGPEIITKLIESVKTMFATLAAQTEPIMAAVSSMITTLVNAIVTEGPRMVESFFEMVNKLISKLTEGDTLQRMVLGAVTLITKIITGIAEVLPKIIDAIINVVVNLIETVTKPEFLDKMLTTTIELILTIILALVEVLPKLIDAMIKLVIALIDVLTRPDILDKLIDATIQLVIAIATALINNIDKLIMAAIRLIIAIAKALWDNRWKILDALRQIGEAMLNKLGEVDWAELGRNIIRGLWNGINNMAGWIKQKIQGFGDGVLKSLKSFFGIKSPSRVMRDEVGKMLGEGLAIGIVRSTQAAVDAAKASAGSISDAFQTNGTISLQSSVTDQKFIDYSGLNPESFDPSVNTVQNPGTTKSADKQPLQLTVQIGEEKIASQIIDLINEKTQMSGRNMIYV